MADPARALAGLLWRWGLQPPAARQGLAQRLEQELGWRDTLALASALGGNAPAVASAAPAPDLQRALRSLRAGFADPTLVRGDGLPAPEDLGAAVAGFRLHHSSQQRAMAARLPALRAQLRAALPAAQARAARLDAVFEQAFNERELQQLAQLPSMLVRRAAQLRAEQADQAYSWPPAGWRAVLWTELQQALDIELALRAQPLLGLQALLQRAPTETSPA